jgi:hypothetical protein
MCTVVTCDVFLLVMKYEDLNHAVTVQSFLLQLVFVKGIECKAVALQEKAFTVTGA